MRSPLGPYRIAWSSFGKLRTGFKASGNDDDRNSRLPWLVAAALLGGLPDFRGLRDGAGLAHCGKAATEAEGDAFNLRPVPVGHGTEFRIAFLAFLAPVARGPGDPAFQVIPVVYVPIQVASSPPGPRFADLFT